MTCSTWDALFPSRAMGTSLSTSLYSAFMLSIYLRQRELPACPRGTSSIAPFSWSSHRDLFTCGATRRQKERATGIKYTSASYVLRHSTANKCFDGRSALVPACEVERPLKTSRRIKTKTLPNMLMHGKKKRAGVTWHWTALLHQKKRWTQSRGAAKRCDGIL